MPLSFVLSRPLDVLAALDSKAEAMLREQAV
jgi:hypothetical protein